MPKRSIEQTQAETLFDGIGILPPEPQVVADIDVHDWATQIGEAARNREAEGNVDEPARTGAYEELGGGRKETDMTDPPVMANRLQHQHHSTRGGRSFPEESGRDVIRKMDDDAQKRDPVVGVPINREAQAALTQVIIESDRRWADGDIVRQMARSRVRAERAKRTDV